MAKLLMLAAKTLCIAWPMAFESVGNEWLCCGLCSSCARHASAAQTHTAALLQLYVPELDRIVLKDTTSERPFASTATCRKAVFTTRVLGLVHELCTKQIHVTKRDLFYTDVKLFEVCKSILLQSTDHVGLAGPWSLCADTETPMLSLSSPKKGLTAPVPYCRTKATLTPSWMMWPAFLAALGPVSMVGHILFAACPHLVALPVPVATRLPIP